ncbi:MAG: hypothetical protein AB1584_24810 [Pseudomonadota bacterium]
MKRLISIIAMEPRENLKAAIRDRDVPDRFVINAFGKRLALAFRRLCRNSIPVKGEMMDLDLLEKRQAALSWRDDLILEMWSIVNRAGMEAKLGVEKDLAEAGIVETLWDPAKFTRGRVDGAMRSAMLNELENLFRRAAENLRKIDTGYVALADALLESLAALKLPSLEPDDPNEVMTDASHKSAPAPTGRLAAMIATTADRDLIKSAKEWGSWALTMVGEASETASQKLQSGTGLHDRLRRSAQTRIETAWMAPTGEPLPLMGQLIAVVENVGNEARSMAL